MVNNDIAVENATIRFRNFSGKEGRYNPVGRRNFCIILDSPKLVRVFEEGGFNVKQFKKRDPDEIPPKFVKVSVSYKNRPPKIVMITRRGQTILDEEALPVLDVAEIDKVDLVVRPYNWTVNGKSGVNAYLKTLYVTIVEDEFERKYEDVPFVGDSPGDDEDFEE